MRWIMLILAALALSVPGRTPAQAAEWPAVDPPGAYRLIGPAAKGPGPCTNTPLCAVETLLACFARLDETLCRAAWPAAPAGLLFGAEQRRQAYWWSYRVAEVAPLGPEEAEIAIAGRHCGLLFQAEPVCRSTPAPATRYRVARGPGGVGWRVLDWRSPPGEEAR